MSVVGGLGVGFWGQTCGKTYGSLRYTHSLGGVTRNLTMLYGKYHMGARDGGGVVKKIIGRYGSYDRYGRYGGYDALTNPPPCCAPRRAIQGSEEITGIAPANE